MAIVVSDTSPIRALAHLQLMHLLGTMFGEVIVPPKVVQELEQPRDGYAAVPIQNQPGFRVVAPTDTQRVQQLLTEVDLGEAEAIALALELQASILLIDEATGRQLAAQHGLQITGAIGILLRAKREGLVPEIRPLLEKLETELHFFISASLRDHSLRQAGELL